MKPPRKHRLTILFAAAILALLVTGYIRFAFDYLSPTHPVESDILVVEGWLPDTALRMAAREFQKGSYKMLITTGFPFSQGVILGVEGKLVFRPSVSGEPIIHKGILEVIADGTEAGGEYAHFRVYADTLYLGESWATSKPEIHQFPINTQLRPDSISIVFDNDYIGDGKDRNLRVKSVALGSQVLFANDPSVFYYFKDSSYYGRKRQMAIGSAHEAAGFLTPFIGSDSLVALETTWKTRSKTYTTAVDVSRWLDDHYAGGDKAVNIWTMGPHARRTWVSYRRAFGNTSDIGIISFSDSSAERKNWWKSTAGWRMVLRETMGLIYISVVG